MSKQIQGILLAGCLAAGCPAYADEAAPRANAWWVEGGVGAAQLETGASAPVSNNRTGVVWTLGVGRHVTPAFGIGVEIGSNQVESFFTCGFGSCYASSQDLARGKEFDHFLVTAQYRPGGNSGWSFGGGLGLMQYCYGQDLNAECQTLAAPGGELMGGYDWRVGRVGRLGLRLAVEAANFPSRPSDGIASFHYSAARLTLNWTGF